MPREKFVKWRLQEEKEGYVPPQCNRRDNTGVLEDIRFISDHIMDDTLSEGKRNNNDSLYLVFFSFAILSFSVFKLLTYQVLIKYISSSTHTRYHTTIPLSTTLCTPL